MSKRISDEESDIYSRLSNSPVRELRILSDERLKQIQSRAAASEQSNHRTRLRVRITAVVMALLVLSISFVVLYELPGGIADRRNSHAIGIEGTLRIPLGKTPEEAVEKFRGSPITQVVHREKTEDGMLLFIGESKPSSSRGLRVEYVRDTWLGWKWVWGGSYGTSTYTTETKAMALDYMSMPSFNGDKKAPFPLVYGEILDASISEVVVATGVNGSEMNQATISGDRSTSRIWFVTLPSAKSEPYSITAYNSTGNIVAYQTINESSDYGSLPSIHDSSRVWMISPLFELPSIDNEGKEITFSLRGIENKIGITDAPLIVGLSQKVLWHFWGDPNEVTGNLLIKGISHVTGRSYVLFESEVSEGGSLRGETAWIPSGIKLTEAGLWKLEVYFNEKLYDSIIVEGKNP